MDYRLRHKIWTRDKGICQNCQRELSELVDPYKDVGKELVNLKKIEIFKYHKNCWKCGKKTPMVTYNFAVGYNYHIGDVKKLDEILKDKYAFVKLTFSKTMGREVIANNCIHCGSLQDNWYVTKDLLTMAYEEDMNKLVNLVLPNNLTLEDLGFQEEQLKPFKRKTSIGHIHHKDGNPENNHPSNLILLCQSCHRKLGIGTGYYRKKREKMRIKRERKQVEKWRRNYYAGKEEKEQEKHTDQTTLD